MSKSGATAVEAGDRLSRDPRLADQVLAGEAVLLDYEGRRIVGLNGSATAVWQRLDGRTSLGEIAEDLARDSGAPVETVTADVIAFADQLVARGLALGAGHAGEGRRDDAGDARRPEERT